MLAHAESEAISLEAPAACGTEAALRERVHELGAGPARHTAVLVTESEGAYRLVVVLPGETRELHDADCRALLEAAAVVIALDGAARTTPPEAAESAPRVAPTPPRVDAPPPSPRPVRVHAPLSLELGGTYGTLPAISAALGGGAGLKAGVLGARIGVHYLAPSETRGAPAVRVQGAQGSLLFTLQAVPRLALALGARANLLHGRGARVDRVRAAWLVAWSGLLEARLTALERPRDQLGIMVGAGLALTRPHFRVTGQGSVHQVAPFQASLGLFWERDFF